MDYFYTYVLFSEKDKRLYIGYTRNIQQRLDLHERGKVKSTFSRRPLRLIYYEAHLSPSTALRRERYYKTSSGRRTLKIVLRESLEEAPGRTP